MKWHLELNPRVQSPEKVLLLVSKKIIRRAKLFGGAYIKIMEKAK